jgi:hypothetical protein
MEKKSTTGPNIIYLFVYPLFSSLFILQLLDDYHAMVLEQDFYDLY